MADTVTFQVTADSTERLDRFLADQLSLSRTQAGRLIANGAVRVNGEPARAGRGLSRADMIEVRFPTESRRGELRPHPIPLSVVYEDDSLLVIDKPAGLVVHPAPGHWNDTLVNALVARGTGLSSLSEGRPGIVHRLDRETSGLLIIAKTESAHRRLARALAARRIERIYAALVWGHVRRKLDIDESIGRHPGDRKRMMVTPQGRRARTTVEHVARFDVCDLVRVLLETGRTHQIRVHLAYVGHPVIGDPTYGSGGARRMTGPQRQAALRVERSTPRQALHAAVLRFEHPEMGTPMELRSEWPADLVPSLTEACGDTELLAGGTALEYLGFFP